MKESSIQKKIIDYLKQLNCYVVKVQTANKTGIPDLLVCFEGKFIAFEIKVDEKKVPSKLQQWNLEQIVKAGGKAYKVSSLKEVKEIISITL